MKKLLILVLAFGFCLAMAGCLHQAGAPREPVTFYYEKKEYAFGSPDGVVGSELREASGHSQDLSYLLSLYMEGPVADELTLSISRKTRLTTVRELDDKVELVLRCPEPVSRIRRSIFFACISQTIFDRTDARCVTIYFYGPKGEGMDPVTILRDTNLYFDDTARQQSEEQTEAGE